jgi:hypothetical protein
MTEDNIYRFVGGAANGMTHRATRRLRLNELVYVAEYEGPEMLAPAGSEEHIGKEARFLTYRLIEYTDGSDTVAMLVPESMSEIGALRSILSDNVKKGLNIPERAFVERSILNHPSSAPRSALDMASYREGLHVAVNILAKLGFLNVQFIRRKHEVNERR